MYNQFIEDESGAVTVDWVVMTAAVVGIGIATASAVSSGMDATSGNVQTQLTSQEISTSFGSDAAVTYWSGNTAQDYLDYGQEQAPGNNGAAYAHAQTMAAAEAPDGFNFDNPLVDVASGNVMYTSDDGGSYSVGGIVYDADSFDGNAQPFTA